MLKHNAIAVAASSLAVVAGCSTVSAPDQQPAAPERAVTVDPVLRVRNSAGVDAEGMYRIGRVYQGQAQYAEAAAAYRRALAIDPAHVEAHNALGVVYAMQGLAGEAETEFKAAIALAPSRSHLHSNLGHHYQQRGRLEEARSALREAVRLSPANVRAWNNLAAAETAIAAAVALPGDSAGAGAPAPASPAQEAITARPGSDAPASTGPELAVDLPQVVVAPIRIVSSAETDAAMPAPREPDAPIAQLVDLAPNVWELRPRLPDGSVGAAAAASGSGPAPDRPAAASVLPAQIRFEVANGNGVTGLARRVGGYLRTLGMQQPRLTNQKPFTQRRTEIQYVAGMEPLARDLRGVLGSAAELVPARQLERSAQLRVLLGRDFTESEAVARQRVPAQGTVWLASGAGRP